MRGALLAAALGAGTIACGGSPPALLAARPSPPPAPHVAAGQLEALALFGDLPGKAMQLGAGPLGVVAEGEAVEGERMGAFVDLPAEVCVLAYARASSSIEDLDLAAFDDDGSPVTVDESPDPKPTFLLCPPHPARVYVAAHVVTGEGLVGVATQLVPRERAGDVGRGVGAHGELGVGPRPADAWQGLDDHVRAHREALGGAWDDLRKTAVVLDSHVPTVVTFPIEADGCLDAVLVPSDDVALLEVEATDEKGRVVARAAEAGSDRTLTVCSPVSSSGSLVIRPHVGRGLAAVVLAKSRGVGAKELAAKELVWAPGTVALQAARADREGVLARAGYGAATVTAGAELTLDRRTTLPLDLGRAPGCSRVDVVGGAPLALVDARIWDDHGGLVSEAEGAWGAALFACTGGKVRIDLEARGRAGPAAVLVRAERWKDPAFVEHPLAAARMLSRATVGTPAMLPGAPASARAATLVADHALSWAETVPAGKCVEVAAGAEGEGTGLELRAFDAATGEEMDRSHAPRAAAVLACAEAAAPRSARFELRVTAGKLDVVIGERAR
jgi:hypothetical protein